MKNMIMKVLVNASRSVISPIIMKLTFPTLDSALLFAEHALLIV
jgi:hypothetical protein